jgi:hypothetical protein
MKSPPPTYLLLQLDASHPQLLNALENLLQLGILNHAQVRVLAGRYLCCAYVPSIKVVPAPINILVPEEPSLPRQPRWGWWQAFRDELSVRWLLFLGLFLVVVSSGVLAASQWSRVSFLGQYSILLGYTLIAAWLGFWAQSSERLRLTSQSLRVLSILLIPINLWGMDSLKISQSFLGIVLGWLSAGALLLIYSRFTPVSLFSIPFSVFTALSLLHWFWSGVSLPGWAIYLGLSIFVLFLVYQRWRFGNLPLLNQPLLYAFYTLTLLLVRGLFFERLTGVYIFLAVAAQGWLLHYLCAELASDKYRRLGKNLGLALIFYSWVVSPHVLTGGLLLQIYYLRLRAAATIRDLIIFFSVSLVTYLRLPSLFPLSLNNFFQPILVGSQDYPEVMYGVTLFPYLWGWCWFSYQLFRQNNFELAPLTQVITLVLGLIAILFSWSVDRTRSLSLFLATATLLYHAYPQTNKQNILVYLSHIFSIITLLSTLNWWFAPISVQTWVILFLVLFIIQLSSSLLQKQEHPASFAQSWYASSWVLGITSAIIIYLLLLYSNHFRLSWLTVPLMLSAIAYLSPTKRRIAIEYSVFAIIFGQIVTLDNYLYAQINLGISAIILLINSFRLPRLYLARLQIIFTLIFILVFLSKYITSLAAWFYIQTLLVSLLWLAHLGLKKYPHPLRNLYAQATDELGKVYCGLILTGVTAYLILEPTYNLASANLLKATTFLLGELIILYTWKACTNLSLFAWLWALELFLYVTLKDNLARAAANIILALILAGVMPWLINKLSWLRQASAIQIIPLFLAVISLLWRLDYFTAQTGLLTLGVALVGLIVSSQIRLRRVLSILSVLTFSLGIYELVIYQLLNAQGGEVINGLLVLCLVATGLAWLYALIVQVGRAKRYVNWGPIALIDLGVIADIHWALGMIIKIFTLLFAGVVFGIFTYQISWQPTLTLLLSSLLLGIYAFWQGRIFPPAFFWIYRGFGDLIITIILARLLWDELGLLEPFWGEIVWIIVILIYYAPWERWGWTKIPWQKTALVIPIVTFILSRSAISDLSLLLFAAFYIQISISRDNLRWSYWSLGLINWLVLRLLVRHQWQDNLGIALVVGLSILYIPQVDPILRRVSQRQARHNWRILGSGVIAVTALLFYQKTGLIPALVGIVTLVIGLGTRIRAFLYVGTITFILTGLYQLVVLNFQYSYAKWVIGFSFGIILILVAANFEQRREQIQRLWGNCLEELSHWE